MIRIEDDKSALYQWDLNRRVELLNIKPGTEVHFTDEHEKVNCPVVISYEENGKIFANIPNIFLQRNGIITAYVYIHEDNKAFTEYHIEILVLSRPKPADYVYTETEVKTWDALDERVKALEKNGCSGGVVNSDSLIMTDRATGRVYTLYINNGKLTMEGDVICQLLF
jgi:hypothetical protein